jgi:hypothetical protein
MLSNRDINTLILCLRRHYLGRIGMVPGEGFEGPDEFWGDKCKELKILEKKLRKLYDSEIIRIGEIK